MPPHPVGTHASNLHSERNQVRIARVELAAQISGWRRVGQLRAQTLICALPQNVSQRHASPSRQQSRMARQERHRVQPVAVHILSRTLKHIHRISCRPAHHCSALARTGINPHPHRITCKANLIFASGQSFDGKMALGAADHTALFTPSRALSPTNWRRRR